MMLIRPVAQTLGNLLLVDVCFLVMSLSLRNAKSKAISLNHPLKQIVEPCLLLATKSFGCMVSSQNLASVQFILHHFMLTTLMPFKLQLTSSITNAPSTSKPMIIRLSPFHISLLNSYHISVIISLLVN